MKENAGDVGNSFRMLWPGRIKFLGTIGRQEVLPQLWEHRVVNELFLRHAYPQELGNLLWCVVYPALKPSCLQSVDEAGSDASTEVHHVLCCCTGESM